MGIMCNSFTKIYFETINPSSDYSRIISKDVLVSIIFHTIAYVVTLFTFMKIFNIKLSKSIYVNVTVFLLLLMTFGYFARLSRSKSIYNYLIKNGKTEKASEEETIKLMGNGYFRFYFLA